MFESEEKPASYALYIPTILAFLPFCGGCAKSSIVRVKPQQQLEPKPKLMSLLKGEKFLTYLFARGKRVEDIPLLNRTF